MKNTARRTHSIIRFDNSIRGRYGGLLCGVDEAGRGPIAGPVVAAAVIFSDDVYIEGVYDSKQVPPAKRKELYEEIISSALSYSIGVSCNNEIDEINILEATRTAMDKAVSTLNLVPELIIADGNFYKNGSAKVENLIKADEKSFTVAAASIIAKVTRDRIMTEYENLYPNFTFSHHKGYCTQKHVDELLEFGYTGIHRRSFNIKVLQGELF
ncbi:MAG: ribonuclease HII [Chlorobi bacterium]|nr:ribonuclease HII [Chlorobiota bacterium]MCI0716572.1 ribonuclease HII [Chlorobiota bacterium]